MISRRSLLRSAAVLSLTLSTSIAYAQSDRDADAERLFNEAKALMEQKKFADACPKLESAYRKDGAQGTLLNLAYCHKEMGSSWLAWTEFREAESKATDPKRKDFARDKMHEIEKEKALSKVVVDPQSKYDLVEVFLEDRRIFDAEKSSPFFAEPGQRKAIFHAKGKKPAILLITVPPAKEKMLHIQVPEMVEEEAGAPPLVVDGPGAVAPPTSTPPPAAEKSSWSGQKTLAVVAGVVGVGGLAVGSIFGLKTMTGACADGPEVKGGGRCTSEDRASASTDGTISTIGFIAGGAFLAGAVVLWITAPSGKQVGLTKPVRVMPSIGAGWAGLNGTF